MSPRARATTYPNRTDLNAPASEPISAVPDQQYGKATQQLNAQRAVPIGTPPGPQAASLPAAALTTGSPLPAVQPGSLPFLHPTQRPDEPVTAGLPFGPGPGPQSMASPPAGLSHQIMSAALTSGSDTLANLALGLKSAGM